MSYFDLDRCGCRSLFGSAGVSMGLAAWVDSEWGFAWTIREEKGLDWTEWRPEFENGHWKKMTR